MNNKTLNIFILTTGIYKNYLQYLYPSLINLFPNLNKHIYLISDKNVKYDLDHNILYDYFHITDLPYPYIAYFKVNYMYDCIQQFKINMNDYFIFLDADSLILKMNDEYWNNLINIIERDKICFSLNPWGGIIDEHNEENKYSATYLNKISENRNKWIQSSLFFGKITSIPNLLNKVNYYIKEDSKNHVFSRLFDETIINKLIIDDDYECNLGHYIINYYGNIKDANDINFEERHCVIIYNDYKDAIFCVQKFNQYIKCNKKIIYV